GGWRSTRRTWGRTRFARRSPSATEAASATTVMPSDRSTTSAMPRRTTSWSSMIITEMGARALGTVLDTPPWYRARSGPRLRKQENVPMTLKVLVPRTVPGDLPEPFEGVSFTRYPSRGPIPAEHTDAEGLLVWGSGPEALEGFARQLPRLRWVQTLAAGPDAVLGAGFAPEVLVTSGRGLHDGPVAEHALALTLAAVRRLDRVLEAQAAREWRTRLAREGDPANPRTDPLTLDGARVLIWGFGSIAARLAPLYSALGAEVTGVATTAGERHGYRVVAREAIEAELPRTDVLVMILPSLPSTHHALDARLLALLPPHAW